MVAGDLDKPPQWFSHLTTTVLEWAAGLFFPLEVVRKSITNHFDHDIVRLAGRYWWFPIFLAFIADGAVLHSFGAELLSEPTLSILYALTLILKPFLEVVLLYFVARAMKAELTFGLTLICYTVMVIYTPIFSWLQLPATVYNFSALAYLKSLHLNLADAFNYALAHGKEIGEHAQRPFPAITNIMGSISSVIYLAASALVAECLHQVAKMSRTQAYGATAIATALNNLPFAVFVFIQLLAVYPYLGAGR